MNELKICKNCKYFQRFVFLRRISSQCVHPNNMDINLVTGKPQPRRTFCASLRQTNLENECGENGRWYESKYVNLISV